MLVSLLFIILLIYVVGLIIKWAFPRLLYWYMRRKVRQQYRNPYEDQTSSRQRQSYNPFGSARQRQQQQQAQRRKPKTKIFGPDDGEYVEFEDIPTYRDPNEPTPPPPPKKPTDKDEPQISDAEWEDIK